MLTFKHINQDILFGTIVLSLVSLACILPSTLPLLPQLVAIPSLIYMWKRRADGLKLISRKTLIGIMVLPVLFFLSSLWSITPEESLMRAVKVTAIILSYLLFFLFALNLSAGSIAFVKKYFYIPLIVAGVYLGVELTADMPIAHLFAKEGADLHEWLLNKNVAVFLLLLPLGLLSIFTSQKKFFSFLLFPVMAVVVLFTKSQASWLALAAMIGVAGCVFCSSHSFKLLWLGLAAILLSMPFIAPYMYHHFAVPMEDESMLRQASFSSRLEIWHFVSQKIMESPLLGFGMDTTRYMEFDNPGLYHEGNTVLHPHNAALQLWSDFGVFGILVVISLLAVFFRQIVQKDKLSQVMYGAVVSGLCVFLLLSWSLWASWLLALIFFLVISTHLFSKDIAR